MSDITARTELRPSHDLLAAPFCTEHSGNHHVDIFFEKFLKEF